jgi:hypothetical protein
MSKGESRISKTHWIVATSKGSRMVVGRDRNGPYSRTSKDLDGIQLHLRYYGLINRGRPFHTCQDDVYWASVGRTIHSLNCLSSWCV